MKIKTELVSPRWSRTNDYLTKDSHIRLFHFVLLLVENDDPNRYKGYDWAKLKKTIGKSIAIFNSTKKQDLCIPATIDEDSIYFREKNNIAVNFLKSIRHAFAHNYIRYDEKKKMLEIYLPSYNRSYIRLHALISYKKLQRIIRELQSQKRHTLIGISK